MNSEVPKQYLLLGGVPVLALSCLAFQNYGVSRLVVVCPPGDEEYVREQILLPYGVKDPIVVPGGKERHDSVYQGLLAAGDCDLVMIHDGARPLVDADTIRRAEDAAREMEAAVAAVPVKDTIKMADSNGNVAATLDRSLLWAVQTPQTFRYPLILEAHEKWRRGEAPEGLSITDDAMMVEQLLQHPVRLTMGSYRNQKITTPEDLAVMEMWMKQR